VAARGPGPLAGAVYPVAGAAYPAPFAIGGRAWRLRNLLGTPACGAKVAQPTAWTALVLLAAAGCSGPGAPAPAPTVCAQAWVEGDPGTSWTLGVALDASRPADLPVTVLVLGPEVSWNATRQVQADPPAQARFAPPPLGASDAHAVVSVVLAGEELILGRVLLEQEGTGHRVASQPEGFLGRSPSC
jgi:hypothetical protein